MVGVGIHHDLVADVVVADVVRFQGAADRVHLGHRNVRVLPAEQTQHTPADPPGSADGRGLAAEAAFAGNAASVEAGRGSDVGFARGEIGHVAADAEPHCADLVPDDEVLALEKRDGRARVGDHLVGPESVEELDALLHPGVVVAVLDARAGAVEEVGRERHVAFLGDPPGHVPNVGVHPENLHEHEHRGSRLGGGRPDEIAPHRPGADRNVDALGGQFHSALLPSPSSLSLRRVELAVS